MLIINININIITIFFIFIYKFFIHIMHKHTHSDPYVYNSNRLTKAVERYERYKDGRKAKPILNNLNKFLSTPNSLATFTDLQYTSSTDPDENDNDNDNENENDRKRRINSYVNADNPNYIFSRNSRHSRNSINNRKSSLHTLTRKNSGSRSISSQRHTNIIKRLTNISKLQRQKRDLDVPPINYQTTNNNFNIEYYTKSLFNLGLMPSPNNKYITKINGKPFLLGYFKMFKFREEKDNYPKRTGTDGILKLDFIFTNYTFTNYYENTSENPTYMPANNLPSSYETFIKENEDNLIVEKGENCLKKIYNFFTPKNTKKPKNRYSKNNRNNMNYIDNLEEYIDNLDSLFDLKGLPIVGEKYITILNKTSANQYIYELGKFKKFKFRRQYITEANVKTLVLVLDLLFDYHTFHIYYDNIDDPLPSSYFDIVEYITNNNEYYGDQYGKTAVLSAIYNYDDNSNHFDTLEDYKILHGHGLKDSETQFGILEHSLSLSEKRKIPDNGKEYIIFANPAQTNRKFKNIEKKNYIYNYFKLGLFKGFDIDIGVITTTQDKNGQTYIYQLIDLKYVFDQATFKSSHQIPSYRFDDFSVSNVPFEDVKDKCKNYLLTTDKKKITDTFKNIYEFNHKIDSKLKNYDYTYKK